MTSKNKMAFASLFTSLSAVEEDVKSPGQPASTCRNETGKGKIGNARKRKTHGEQTGPYKKKQCYQAQTTRTYNATVDDSKAIHHHMHNTDSERARVSKEVIHNHNDKGGNKNMCHKGQNYKTKNNRNGNKQREQKKKTDRQKNQHQQKDRGRPAYRGGSHQNRPMRQGGGDRKYIKNKQDFQLKHPRFMTQEFKDQNVMMVDGRLLCRHFLFGRCIKGDDCQLEHVQGYNDLIKESCKFYVQGFCTKGGSCPYMHKSFPCMFFHRKGKCSQGADCRFSHEPLNDVTNQLLDEALKRNNDHNELVKKAEQESSRKPANTDEPEIIETNRGPDIFLQPLRPSFYKSADTNAEKEALFCPTEEVTDIVQEAVPPDASDAVQPHSPPSTNLNPAEPVCYSVEAVLGRQLSRPFTSLFTTPRCKEFAPLSSSDCTSDSAKQTQVPYSVDAVLRSCKSVENSTFGNTPTLPAQTVSYTPKTYFKEVTHPLLSPETPNKKVLCLVNTMNEANESQGKSQSSLQVHTDLSSKTCLKLPLASGDHQKQCGDMSESPKPAQRASHEVKLDFLCTDIKCTVPSFELVKHKSMFSRPLSQTSASKHPTPLKPHLSVLTPDSQASFKPFCPPSGFTQSSHIEASDSANTVSCHFLLKQHTEIHVHSKETQSGLKQHNLNETTAECSSKMAHCGDLAAGCKKTLKRPFHCLFTSPITDTLQPIDDSVSSSCPQGSIQSSCPAPQSADCRSNHLKPREPDKASARSFLALFAAPLSAAPLPCSQQSVDNPSHSSDSKKRASDLETPLSQQARTEEISSSANFCPDPKIGKNSSPEHINQPTEQLLNPASPAACGDSPLTSHAHKQLPDISSHRGSAEAATNNSVLKTLFLCLSPYQQDRIQISVPSECEKDKNGTQSVFGKQQRKSRKKGRQKKLETEDTHIQCSAHYREHQPSPQTSQISLEATGWSTLSSPGMTEPQVRDSGTHNLPFKPVVPLMPHHIQPRLKHTSEEGKCVNATVAATSLKGLFKPLDTAVFHVGH